MHFGDIWTNINLSCERRGDEAPSNEAIAAALRETDYKYFGDYEMGDDQRSAVGVLESASRHMMQFHAEIVHLREALEAAEGFIKQEHERRVHDAVGRTGKDGVPFARNAGDALAKVRAALGPKNEKSPGD